jgi:hypothetical protein
MADPAWQLLVTAPNVPAARALATRLEGEGVDVRVDADTALLGEGRPCSLMVEASSLRRARQVLAEADFTDAELDFLATGWLSCDDARE